MATRFRLLGPLEVINGTEPVPLGAVRLRAVLATLLLNGNEFVSTDRLIVTVWGQRPPARSKETLHTHIMRLRRIVRVPGAPDPIRTRPGGYMIETTPHTLDLDRFRELTDRKFRGSSRAELEAEAGQLAAAHQLWRGAPLANVESEALHREEVPRLIEEWLMATGRRIDVQLALGLHADVIGELRCLTAEYPLHERFWAQIMTALFRSGRQCEALDAYQCLRRRLAEDLGIDPSLELRQLQGAILCGTDSSPPSPGRPATAAPAAPGTAAGTDHGSPDPPDPARAGSGDLPPQTAPRAGTVAGCQLPPGIADFVGRRDPTDQVAAALLRAGETEAPAGAVICGAPGMGKTALATRVGHRIRDHFPDGVWFVSLRCVTGLARTPADVLDELLRMMGVEQRRAPAGTGARAAVYRAVLSGRRALIVLDDALDPVQVHPLLPGTSSCAVLATSRTSIPDLAALYGFFSCVVAPLDPAESIELMTRIMGAERLRTEHAAARELASLCGHVPLAIRIASAHLSAHPGQRLADYLAWLRGGSVTARLSLGPGPSISVRASFEISYTELSGPARRLFGLLGLVDGDDIAAAQAAALLGTAVEQGRPVLDELAAAGLLGSHGRAGYRLAGLLRRYALEKLAEEIPQEERAAARGRLDDLRARPTAGGTLVGNAPGRPGAR